MLGGSTQTLTERIQALEARLANMAALTTELATLKAHITLLEAQRNTALSHQTFIHEDPHILDPRISIADHSPYMGVPEHGRFFYQRPFFGGMVCKLCMQNDHAGSHLRSSYHAEAASQWLTWAKQVDPMNFQDQASVHGNQNSYTPASQYPAPTPALSLPHGQVATFAQTALSLASSASASDTWAGYGKPSGASAGTGGHPTPWASSSNLVPAPTPSDGKVILTQTALALSGSSC